MDDWVTVQNKQIVFSHKFQNKPEGIFHAHDFYEIHFFVSGDVKYYIEQKIYYLNYGDTLIMRNEEFHKFFRLSDKIYEKIIIHFNPKLFTNQDLGCSNILRCFTDRSKGEKNKIQLSYTQTKEMAYLLEKMEAAEKMLSTECEYLKLSYLIQILVLLNQAFDQDSNYKAIGLPEKVQTIIDFIDNNLEGDLRLSVIEKTFYISHSQLCQIFKLSIGMGIHEYIVHKRIYYAKKLLLEGLTVTEACSKSGFNDYSNFLRTFKKILGVSPGQYIIGKKTRYL